MIFRQILNADLACASYLLADAGVAAVVDPARRIDPYLELAEVHGLEIKYVIDTHLHADHVSGRERLAAIMGARALLAGESFAGGDILEVGRVRLEALATPGHRSEHVSLLVADLACSPEPCLLLAGDSILAGGLARPDLATATDAEQAARDLFATVERLARLPDYVEVWPGHIGGSLCAINGLSGRPSSTVGYERRSNPALSTKSTAEFIGEIGTRLTDPPPTVEIVVALNRRLEDVPPQPIARLGPHEVADLVVNGAAVIDGRPPEAFDEASIPGSLSIPLDGLAVGTRAAWSADPNGPVIAVGDNDNGGLDLAARLAAVGFQDLRGILTQGFRSWVSTALPARETRRLEPEEVDALLARDAITLVDLRDSEEYAACHVPGALHLPWRELRHRGSEAFHPGKPVVVACTSGGRTPLGASILARHGGQPVSRVVNGGIPDLETSVQTGARSPRGSRRGSGVRATPATTLAGG